MEIFDQEFHDDQTNFDDRMEEHINYLEEIEAEFVPPREDDLYYRHPEDY